jgi:hypothetical protein
LSALFNNLNEIKWKISKRLSFRRQSFALPEVQVNLEEVKNTYVIAPSLNYEQRRKVTKVQYIIVQYTLMTEFRCIFFRIYIM